MSHPRAIPDSVSKRPGLSRSRLRWAVAPTVVSALVLPAQALAPKAPPTPASSFANQRAGVAYVGTASCVDCHSLLAESFAAHGMARTFARMDSTRTAADWSTDQVVVDQRTGLRYQPYRDGDRFFIRETLLDQSNHEIHSLIREAHHAIGSGHNDQGFVNERNGFLRILPLEWYADEKRWDFAPVFEVENQRFSRRLNARCMSCHNATPTFQSEAAARFALPLPSGISCERCHGPGELHVKARLHGYSPAGGVDTTIVNPRHLPAARQLDVCAQCHLQGDAEVIQSGKNQLSFRPGERLADHRALFVSRGASADTADFGFVRHVERLVLSRCFTESKGAMTCTSCHDPHRSSVGVAPTEWDAACARCHGPDACALPLMPSAGGDTAHPGGGDAVHAGGSTHGESRAGKTCVECHMRRSEPYDVLHVSITDHWIRRRIAPPARSTVARFRPDPKAPLERFALPGEEKRAGSDDLELLGIASEDLGLHDAARGALLEAAGSGKNPLQTAARSLHHPRARFAAARLLVSDGDSSAARAVLEGAVADYPDDPKLLAELARIEAAMGDGSSAFAHADRAWPLDFNDPEVARLIAEIAATGGDYRRAIEAYGKALTLDPDDTATLLGLGRSLLRVGDNHRAAGVFARAADELPFSAEVHGSLGFALAATRRPRLAIDAYRRAIALAPKDADLQFNLGNSLAAAADTTAAEEAYRTAIRLNPDHYRAYGNLGFLLRNRGDFSGARRAFERVLELRPDDATARKALEELGK